jgi:hypothetical protein
MCAQGLVYVFEDVHSLCSRMYIVCVRGLVYVLRDVGICVQGLVYVLRDVNGVLKVVNVCSRMCICVRGCDRCPKS